MAVHPAPTSLKQRLQNKPTEPIAQVWPRDNAIVQPPRTPWGRIWLLVIALTLLVGAGLLAGTGILVQRYPDSPLARFWPTSSTTVIREKTSAVATPGAVKSFAESLLGVVAAGGTDATYVAADYAGPAVPLSSNGWAVVYDTLAAADNLALIPFNGAPVAVETKVLDPAAPFIYLKVSGLASTPATLVASTADLDDTPVWVVSASPHDYRLIKRTIVGRDGPAVNSSDQLANWLVLDSPVTSPIGAAVVDEHGDLVGLMGADQKVWPTAAIEPILRPLLQQGLVDRPKLGLRALDLGRAVVTADPTASGWKLAASADQPAVEPDSPAAVAGLQTDDRLLSINDQAFDSEPFLELLDYQPGATITIKYDRAGVKKETSLTLGTLAP